MLLSAFRMSTGIVPGKSTQAIRKEDRVISPETGRSCNFMNGPLTQPLMPEWQYWLTVIECPWKIIKG